MLALASLVLAALPLARAHGGVLSYQIGSSWSQGWSPYNTPSGQTTIHRPWATYNPIQDATSSQLACNDDGTSGALQLTATVAAGSKITAYWNQVWPHALGPMLTYMAKCPGSSCTGVNANSLKWFKIDQSGLLSGNVGSGTWGDGLMIQQNSSWTSTIPASIPSGDYLIRFETIALHSLPAQFYPECAQLHVTGGGSLAPTSAELVSFPGGYSNSDPGLSVNLYTTAATAMTCYPMPGPPLYAGATVTKPSINCASGSTGSTGSTGSGSTGTGSTGTGSTGSGSTGSGSTSSGTVAEYGQCGGSGYSGPTGCVSPYTCKVVNDYYSQCT
jgi:hypothetical protein